MTNMSEVQADMEVLGSDGKHVGKVDHMDGADVIKLARQDSKADGEHHWIPLAWVDSVEGDKLKLRLSADDAMEQWQSSNP